MFTEAFFTIVANQKNSMSISRLMDKQIVVHLCNGILLSKRKEKKEKGGREGGKRLIHASTWRNLKIIMLSRRCQRQMCDFIYIENPN